MTKWLKKLEMHFYETGYALDKVGRGAGRQYDNNANLEAVFSAAPYNIVIFRRGTPWTRYGGVEACAWAYGTWHCSGQGRAWGGG